MLALLHPKLPLYIRDIYQARIREDVRIMDFKEDILRDADAYLSEHEKIDKTSQNEDEEPKEEVIYLL